MADDFAIRSGVLGIDPSLNSTGYSYVDSSGDLRTGLILPKGMKGMARLSFVRASINELLMHRAYPALVVYEGYAMGVRGGGRVFDIGELGGVLKLLAWDNGFDILSVPPSNLKQFITGKGNAKKEDMPYHIRKRYGVKITQDDEADAFGLMKMGEAFLDRALLPRVIGDPRREALQKCTLDRGRR